MNKRILIENINIKFARKITKNQSDKYGVLPLYLKNNIVYVARSKLTREGEEFLQFLLKSPIQFIDISEEQLKLLANAVLDYEYENLEEVIFNEAISLKASDIHFEPNKDDVIVRFRIHSALVVVKKLNLEEYAKVLLRLKVNSNMDIAEKMLPQDGKLSMICGEKRYNCRLSTIPVVFGEKIVIRILYDEVIVNDIENMNFTSNQKSDLDKIIKVANGLVLVCGPTGSGKSTTLYAVLEKIKKGNINITTLEDPIEVVLDGVNQIYINEKVGITFAKGLRHVLRQDPDVVMIGEIRDEATAKMSVRAAITGHKVYSTIHTKSPEEVFVRLEEMGVSGYLIRSSLVGIVCQRLVKVLCNKCKIEKGVIKFNGTDIKIYEKCGCPSCNGIGYVGRKLVSSVVYISKEIRNNIVSKSFCGEQFQNKQMKEMIDSLLLKGEIDFEEYSNFVLGEELDE